MRPPEAKPLALAIIGAGWAGMAAAVEAVQSGHAVTVFEATRQTGGRARALPGVVCKGQALDLDNGQHILIGAYTETLRLMRRVGVPVEQALRSLPMTLRFADGAGLRLPNLPAPFNTLVGLLTAVGWQWQDKAGLLRAVLGWQWRGFDCASGLSVAELCHGLTPRVMAELIEPLCVSALNTPSPRASASVFLRVLGDALFGVAGGSRLLLPRVDLGTLFPQAAARWLVQRGGAIRLGSRVKRLVQQDEHWQIEGQVFDNVILATDALQAVRLLDDLMPSLPGAMAEPVRHWIDISRALKFEAITTVYAWAPQARLSQPMLALRSQAGPNAPAQFVFDRGQLGGPDGLLAFVVSASQGEHQSLQQQVLQQAQAQLGLHLQAVQTVVEKRATFACTPGLQRPPVRIGPGLFACGDYVAGPYPATLEGAVRSAIAAVKDL